MVMANAAASLRQTLERWVFIESSTCPALELPGPVTRSDSTFPATVKNEKREHIGSRAGKKFLQNDSALTIAGKFQ
jgi:hypothetical protein